MTEAEILEHLHDDGPDRKDAAAHPAFIGFATDMEGRRYGCKETRSAWSWYSSGYEEAQRDAKAAADALDAQNHEIISGLLTELAAACSRAFSAGRPMEDAAQTIANLRAELAAARGHAFPFPLIRSDGT